MSGSYTGGSVQDVFEDFCSFGAGSAGKVSAAARRQLEEPHERFSCEHLMISSCSVANPGCRRTERWRFRYL